MKKITFLGDIMAEPPVLKAAKKKDGSYCFDGVFARVRPLLAKSDFVVGNLETPLAGEAAGYTRNHLGFNAPDEYADACKKAGINLLSTANNHTFDRGYDGMTRTIRVLEEKGIGHTGSFLPGTEREEAYYFELDGTKCAVICYTYGTNHGGSGGKYLAEGEYAGTVNLTRPQTEGSYLPGVLREKDWVDKLYQKLYPDVVPADDIKGNFKRLIGMESTYARADDHVAADLCAPYLAQLQADIRKAKEKADLVFVYPHNGGQFNAKPGEFSKYVVEKAVEAGADAVLCTHSHIPQRMERKGGAVVSYCLGNFNMNPESFLAMPKELTNYGYTVHFYVEDGKLVKTTFSMMKNYVEKDGQISSYPVWDPYDTLPEGKKKAALKKDITHLYGRITGKYQPDVPAQDEYEF